MKYTWIAAVLFLVIETSAVYAIDVKTGEVSPECSKILSPEVVSNIAGRKAELAAYDPMKGAGGQCNYAAGGQMLLLLNVDSGGAAQFAKMKSGGMYKEKQKTLSGVGDEAFSSSPAHHIVVARKGNRIVTVASFMDASANSLLSVPQLSRVAASVLNAK